jgi:ribosomal protein S8
VLHNHPDTQSDTDILQHIKNKGYVDNLRYLGKVYKFHNSRGDLEDLRQHSDNVYMRYQYDDDKNDESIWDIQTTDYEAWKKLPEPRVEFKIWATKHARPRIIKIMLRLDKASIVPSNILFEFN